MIRIAIELLDKNIFGVDLTRPETGNPGIGGSEWLFLILAKLLCDRYGTKYNVTIYHNGFNDMPEGINVEHFEEENELIKLLEKNNEDIFIHQINRNLNWYEDIKKIDVIDVPWAHCYLGYPEMKAITDCSNVKRVVFVGKEEYDSYIDDDIIEKATYIYNMAVLSEFAPKRIENEWPTVLFLGALTEGKAFDELARIWPQIIDRVPGAKLKVAGSGRLYQKDSKLGDYGIADTEYERKFIKYLVDEEGKIMPSVTFLGTIDEKDKEEQFQKVMVGVVNPRGKDETFCLSAVEMEDYGIPVVSVAKYGLLDTVRNRQTGLLFHTRKQFIKCMVKLLTDYDYNRELGLAGHGFVKKFEAGRIIEQWDQLFMELEEGLPTRYKKPIGNYRNDLKYLKVVIRFLRFDLNMRYLPSVNKSKYIVKRIIGRV